MVVKEWPCEVKLSVFAGFTLSSSRGAFLKNNEVILLYSFQLHYLTMFTCMAVNAKYRVVQRVLSDVMYGLIVKRGQSLY